MKQDQGPGVPEAIPRTVHGLGLRLDPGTVDRLWIFPPMVRGRKEWGLVAVSRFQAGGAPAAAADADGTDRPGPRPADGDRRHLFTAPYSAERTGKGLTLSWSLDEQGQAPPDRLPRVMHGVVRRAGDELGDPREVEIAGDPARFDALLDELGKHLLEPAPPAASEPPPASSPEAASPSEPVPSAPEHPPAASDPEHPRAAAS